MKFRTYLLAALVATMGLAAGHAMAADTISWNKTVPIVDTVGPGGALGFNGPSVNGVQRVAARFTVPSDGDMRLARMGLWLMNNSETMQKRVRLTLETDAIDEGGLDSMPSGVELERWTAPVATLGWDPVQQFFVTKKGPRLVAGRSYWVVAASMAPPRAEPIWTFAKHGTMVTAITENGDWQPAIDEGSALTLRIDARPVKSTP